MSGEVLDAAAAGADSGDLDEAELGPGGHTARWVALVVGVVMVLFLVLLATRQFGSETADSNPIIGKVAPPVEGTTLDGDVVSIDAERGNWVVVNFFATWCVPCRVEFPELVEFTERHRDDGVEVVSVVFDDPDTAAVGDFFEENGGTWPVVVEGTGRIALDYGVTGVPESYLISPNGYVVAGFQGVTADELDGVIDDFEARAEEGSGS